MRTRREPTMRYIFASLLTICLSQALKSPLPSNFPSKTNVSSSAVHLRVVHFNDVYKLDYLPKFKGFLELLKKQSREEGITECICTLGGDFFSPSLLSSIDQGKAMVACLSEFVDYACLGNHEADHGTAAFQANVNNFGGTIINSNFPTMPTTQKPMPEHVTLNLKSQDNSHKRKVKLLGLLEPCPNLYLKGAFCDGAIEDAIPIADCMEQQIQSTKEEEQDTLLLPLTHQDMELDLDLAKDYGCPKRMPVILGGHDHDAHDTTVPIGSEDGSDDLRCRVLKGGLDAEKAIVLDISWESESTEHPKIQVEWVDVPSLEESCACTRLIEKVDVFREPLRRLDRTVLKVLESRDLALSSVGVRKHQTTIGSLICTALRKSLRADVSVMNGGSIRGNTAYTSCIGAECGCEDTSMGDKPQFFTFADLLQELPYVTEVVVIGLPGRVLEEAIDYSRRQGGDQGDAGFLQVCNKLDVVQEPCGRFKILQVRGQPFDPNRMYNVATMYHLIHGMDDIKPLVEYAKQHPDQIPPIDAARPAKELVLQVYFREIWMLLGEFEDIDINGTGYITEENLGAALTRRFGINPENAFVSDTLRTFDPNNDGYVTKAEFEACLHAIKRNRFDLSPNDCKGIAQCMDVVKYLNNALTSKNERRAVEQIVQRETIPAGQNILEQGEEGHCMYLCEEGVVSFIADGKNVGSCGKGGSFGELSLLYDSPRAATCIAATDCKLWKIDKEAFNRLLVRAANRHNEQVMKVIQYLQRALKEPATRTALQKLLPSVRRKKGDLIIRQGDAGDCLYFLEKGNVSFIADGKEVGCCGSGGSFGELALLYDTPRAASCMAMTDCQLWKVDREAFQSLLSGSMDAPKVESIGTAVVAAMSTSSRGSTSNTTAVTTS